MKRLIFVFLFITSLFITSCKKCSNSSELLTYRDLTGLKKPVKSLAEWEQKRGQILDSMQAAMGQLPDRSDLPPLDIQITDSMKENNYVRYTISFTVADNEQLPAYLYVPIQKGKKKRLPAMLASQPTGSFGKKIVDGQSPGCNNCAYGKELAQRGYVVIAPDYPSFGDLKDYDFKTDRYQSGTMKSIFDDMRCVDLLQAREDVDPERIGIIGHSLGGHDAIFVGAFDIRLKVIVSSSGWTLLHYYDDGNKKLQKEYGGKLWGWAQDRYMPLFRDKYNLDPDKIPFDFDEVIAALAPRAFFSNSPLYDGNFNIRGVKKGIAVVAEVYRFLGAEENLQFSYPEAKHDFPPEVRLQSYRFIDKMLKHTPNAQEIK